MRTRAWLKTEMFTKSSLGKEEERQMLAHLGIHAVLSAARAAPFVREQVCSRQGG